jgi:hypothetical protein
MDKELFDKGLIGIIRRGMVSYDKAMESEWQDVSSIEISSMGNFIDPETGRKYGYKLTIGEPNFWEEKLDDEDFDDD